MFLILEILMLVMTAAIARKIPMKNLKISLERIYNTTLFSDPSRQTDAPCDIQNIRDKFGAGVCEFVGGLHRLRELC